MENEIEAISDGNHIESEINTEKGFFLRTGVKKRKNNALKNTLRTLIKRLGKSESEFYQEMRLTKQYWYGISWGLLETPLDVKIKISRALDTDTSLIWKNDILSAEKIEGEQSKGNILAEPQQTEEIKNEG